MTLFPDRVKFSTLVGILLIGDTGFFLQKLRNPDRQNFARLEENVFLHSNESIPPI